ncbi:alkaline phosphatase [Sandaracinobacter sp.]|uniref:alkaline phosphatase D family protein n=1 Tax=Sandaracinobacter sp. TaxID=2487581 RepID=UPI0035AEFE47
MAGRDFDRRTLLAGAAAGAGLLLPGVAWAQRRKAVQAAPLGGFTHGVASGEPSQTSMLFWTRFEGAGGQAVPLELEISGDPRMARARVMGQALAEPGRDWTARVTVKGLAPGRTYYYRFIGPGKNVKSAIGRTHTLPEGSPAAFRMGVFSCSNLPFGWFNAYAHAVAADDIDLIVHLGDYIYEYARGTYPGAREAVAGRVIEPAGETIRREDYWARYRGYRADPDLQALHTRVPAVTVWDDHEIANDAWRAGAENHGRDEGEWAARVAAAKAAYRDWMPVSDALWASYDIGRLATLYRLETRVSGRDEPLDLAAAIRKGPDTMTALKRLRDEQWVAGNRQLLGVEQEQWLFAQMQAAAKRGVRWQVLGQQVVMGKILMPQGASQLAGPNPSGEVAAFLGAAELSAKLGLPLNMDSWDGYPAARARVLGMAQKAGADLVVLAGDSHNAWASDLVNDGRPAGVEFAGQSVSSPGFEHYLRSAPPAQVAGALTAANPTLRWADTSGRGYMQVVLTPAEALCEWRFTQPVTARSDRLARVQRARVGAGQRRLQMG